MSSVLSVASITCLLLLSTIALTIVLRLSIGRFVFACAIFSSFSLLVYYSSAILHSGGGRLSKVCISMSALTGSIVLASLVCASILFVAGPMAGCLAVIFSVCVEMVCIAWYLFCCVRGPVSHAHPPVWLPEIIIFITLRIFCATFYHI
jgi:hypothetical protein